MVEVTSMYKSMIKREDSMHKSSISNLQHKGSEHVQATKLCLMEMNGDNVDKMNMWSKAYQLSDQDIWS